MRVKALTILTGLLAFLISLSAQVPAGYVQTTATVPALANGQFASSWTNLSPNPQLGLLGCVSTFQTTVSGRFDAYGHFAVPLADTAQICPAPSTWTFTFTFFCTPPSIPSAFTIQVPVTGGTEDISAQITPRLPVTQCSSGGGGGGGGGITPSPQFSLFYQPTPGTVGTAQGDPNATTDGAGNITVKSVATPGVLQTSGVTPTAFQYPLPFFVPPLASWMFSNATTTTTLGIDVTSGAAQGYAENSAWLWPTHGGQYSAQQENQYSNYFAWLDSSSQGTMQAYAYHMVCLGDGDCVAVSGDVQQYGGMPNKGFIGTPAFQGIQNSMSTGNLNFKATISGSYSPGTTTYTYIPTQNEGPSGGSRTIYDLDQIINTGTCTFATSTVISGVSYANVVTCAGAPNFLTLSPKAAGQTIFLGTTTDGYAPNQFGTAGGATALFQSFSNPGQVYVVSLGSTTGSGLTNGAQAQISGCGAGDAVVNIGASGGVATGVSLAAIPSGSSGYTVTSNCTVTLINGATGTPPTVNIVQVTGVVCSAGQLFNVNNFSGGQGAQSSLGFTGQLEMACTGTNTVAVGTPFNGGGFRQPYHNVVNATAAQIVLATPATATGAIAAGNITLTNTTFPCQGDDVSLNGDCTGHPLHVIAALSSTQLQLEGAPSLELTTANSVSVPYAMIQSLDLTDINKTNHTITAFGILLSAQIVSAGSGTTVGSYLLNDNGANLGPGFTCNPGGRSGSTPACAQVLVNVNNAGQAILVTKTNLTGPPGYIAPPVFTMTNSSLNTGGGTAGCGGTCPTFSANLDNNVQQYAFGNGDHLFQPPDPRVSIAEDQGIETVNYLGQPGTGVQLESLGTGRINSAVNISGNSGTGLGGYVYGINMSPGANSDYFALINGGTNAISGMPYKFRHSLFSLPGMQFGDAALDFHNLGAVPTVINLSGATINPITPGTGQPNENPAVVFNYKDSLCFVAVWVTSAPTCPGSISGIGQLNPSFGLSLSPGTLLFRGYPAGITAAFSDNVTGHSGHFFESASSGADIEGGWFANSGLKTEHSYTFAAAQLFDAAQAATTFVNGIRLTGSQFLTSTDGVVANTQVVTKTPTGPVPANGVLPTTIYSAAGTPLPSCAAGIKGQMSVVSDATAPTYLGAYASGGAVVAPVMCNGSGWVTY